jgi:hypothetical protein
LSGAEKSSAGVQLCHLLWYSNSSSVRWPATWVKLISHGCPRTSQRKS